jgi:hypothetical protein
MTYRDETMAARDKRDRLRRELDAIDRALEASRREGERRRVLAGELAEVERDLDHARAKVSLPLLAQVRVASPCTARWDQMRGDEHARHCGQCDKTVYDLSSLTAAQAEALLRSKGDDGLCVRFYRRRDGTVITSDCPVGARRARVKRYLLAGVVGTVIASGAVWSALLTIGSGPIGEMGEPALMGEMPEPLMGAIPLPVEPPSSVEEVRGEVEIDGIAEDHD